MAVNRQAGWVPKGFGIGRSRLLVVRDVSDARKLRYPIARAFFKDILSKGCGDVKVSAGIRHRGGWTGNIGWNAGRTVPPPAIVLMSFCALARMAERNARLSEIADNRLLERDLHGSQ